MADDFLPIKRPKPGDGEEELMRLQTEYEEKKFIPCAKVINLRSQKIDDKPVTKKSVFAQRRSAGLQSKGISTSQCSGNLTNLQIGKEIIIYSFKLKKINLKRSFNITISTVQNLL